MVTAAKCCANAAGHTSSIPLCDRCRTMEGDVAKEKENDALGRAPTPKPLRHGPAHSFSRMLACGVYTDVRRVDCTGHLVAVGGEWYTRSLRLVVDRADLDVHTEQKYSRTCRDLLPFQGRGPSGACGKTGASRSRRWALPADTVRESEEKEPQRG